MRKLFRATAAALAVLAALAGAGCSPGGARAGEDTPAAGDGLRVVATTTMLGDLASVLGGEYISAETLMGEGVDPHTYQASAGDLRRLRSADMILVNGLGLEGRMSDVFRGLEGEKTVVAAGDAIGEDSLRYIGGVPDPHIWFSVPLWKEAAEYVSSELAELDPENAEGYAALLEDYIAALDELDGYIRERAAELPPERRVLVTAHDAFGYFGEEYGFEVRGIQGMNTSAEAGTAEISALADMIAERGVRAVFVETSVPQKSAEALIAAVRSRGGTLEIGGSLYSDSLGDGEDAAYTAAFRKNIDTIVSALSGEGAAE